MSFAPKWSLSHFQPILAAIFVTIATVKIESIRDFNIWAIVIINKYEETCEKQFSLFGFMGGWGRN